MVYIGYNLYSVFTNWNKATTKLHLAKSIYYRFFQDTSYSHNGIKNVRRFDINMWALLMCDDGIVGSYIYNKIGVTLTILP